MGFKGSAKEIIYPLIKLQTIPNLNPLKNCRKLKFTKGDFKVIFSFTIYGEAGFEKSMMQRPKSA